jgi:hypothetical protein
MGSLLASDVAPQLRTLIEDFQTHRRVAVGYLRTNNVDLAVFEVERLRDRWNADVRKIPREHLREDLNAAIVQIETATHRALQAADKGDLEQALVGLEGDELLTAGGAMDCACSPIALWRPIPSMNVSIPIV